jgi:hypothetical protein
MGLRTVFVARNQRARCAALRDGVLQCGRCLGWPTRTAIAFTEQLARRPWKRCSPDQLEAVLDELHVLQAAFEVRKHGPATAMLAPALVPARPGGRRAPVG